MKSISITIIFFLCIVFSALSFSQSGENPITQTVRGIVKEYTSGMPLSYVTISLPEKPEIGTITDENGEFILREILLGRYSVQAGFLGYEPTIIKELRVSSAKEVYLEIFMKESSYELEEITVTPQINKDQLLNSMALTGGRMLRVEEAARYAGGMDDPARLVSSFAGVSPGISTNGISVHGNAPHLLQWRLEEVEIPNPNHFADISVLGGGVLSSLSSHVLGNSDFFAGAFPAEYSNAVSEVFDMKLRTGNTRRFENTFQAGILGLDFASEGPLSRKNNASYIFNYRYSTTGLLKKINPDADLGGTLDYQDLNFKINLPTSKAGIFSLWGTALIDKADPDFDADPNKWKYKEDAKASVAKQSAGGTGLTHRYYFNNYSTLKTTLATTWYKNDAKEDIYDENLNPSPYLDFYSEQTNIILTSSLNRTYNANHTNKTGFTFTNMQYNMNLDLASSGAGTWENRMQAKGNTRLFSAYTSSYLNINHKISLTLGLNGQFLSLNNHWTVEPRAAIKWQSSPKSSFAFAYGLHSRMEKTDVYFVKDKHNPEKWVNKDLDFIKTHHLMVSYTYRISEDMNIKIEPYFQYLYHVPVIADSSYSILNRKEFYMENALVNEGKGRNYGIDITFEKYLSDGMYYMITASVFNSEYRGGDKIWYSTRYNRNFILNGLIGKEWTFGKNNERVLSANLKLTLQGGDRYAPVNTELTMVHPDKEVQYNEKNAYTEQFNPMFIADYSISYKINRRKTAHEFAIKGINATGYKEYYGHEYNLKTGIIEPNRHATSLINVSYKFDF